MPHLASMRIQPPFRQEARQGPCGHWCSATGVLHLAAHPSHVLHRLHGPGRWPAGRNHPSVAGEAVCCSFTDFSRRSPCEIGPCFAASSNIWNDLPKVGKHIQLAILRVNNAIDYYWNALLVLSNDQRSPVNRLFHLSFSETKAIHYLPCDFEDSGVL